MVRIGDREPEWVPNRKMTCIRGSRTSGARRPPPARAVQLSTVNDPHTDGTVLCER